MGQLKEKNNKNTKVLFKEIACLSIDKNNPYNDKSQLIEIALMVNSYLIPEFKYV
jgi:hypothetical protein